MARQSKLEECMNDRHWEMLADLLNRVANADQTWKEKARILALKMRENGAEASLVEIAEWSSEFGEPVE
jgi:hypothetical protein